jgi:hypothetical protein
LQIHRKGKEIAQLDIDDPTLSEPASRSQSPYTPAEPPFVFATPAFPRVNNLATPASSAFHRRARVSSGSLVDSPYDPFVEDQRADGEPERKRVRKSWGNEGRWKLQNQKPSPTKKTTQNTWLADAERSSPEPKPIPPPEEPVATTSETQTIQSQLAQELVDMVSGATEEDTDTEHAKVDNEDFVQEQTQEVEEPSLRRSQFAVFRDEPTPTATFTPKPEAVNEKSNITGRIRGSDSSPAHAGGVQDSRSPHLVDEYSSAEKDPEAFQVKPASSSAAEEVDYSQPVDPALSVGSFGVSQTPASNLPSIQTSGFGFGFGQPVPMAPPSTLPRSPRTPDIRPQQSASLPLPSPFPGDNLATSYMDANPSTRLSQNLFGSSGRSSESLAPDHLFGFGFGYGSGGLVQNLQHAVPASTSDTFRIGNDGTQGEPIEPTFLQEDRGMYFPSDIPMSTALELEHLNEGLYILSDDQGPDHSRNLEKSSPYPENMPAELVDQRVDLERTNDPIGLKAYKEFIHDQEEDGQQEQESASQHHTDPGGSQRGDGQLERKPDVTTSKEEALQATAIPASSASLQQQSIAPISSAPIVIDLLSSSESESASESDGDVEIVETRGSIIDLEAEDADSSEDDFNSSELLSDEFSEDGYNASVVRDHPAPSDEFSEDGYNASVIQEHPVSSEGENGSALEEHEFEDQGTRMPARAMDESPEFSNLDGSLDSSAGLYATADPVQAFSPVRAQPVAFLSLQNQLGPSVPQDPVAPTISRVPVQFLASQPVPEQQRQPPPSMFISSTAPAPRRQRAVVDLGDESDSDNDRTEDASLKEQIVSMSVPEDLEEEVILKEADEQSENKVEKPVITPRTVTFPPRVTRARAAAAAADQYATQAEMQSSVPLQTSQASRSPKMVVQDTFEGRIRSDDSIAAAPSFSDLASDDLRRAALTQDNPPNWMSLPRSPTSVQTAPIATIDSEPTPTPSSYLPISSPPEPVRFTLPPATISPPPTAQGDEPRDRFNDQPLYPDLEHQWSRSETQSHSTTAQPQSLTENNLPMTPDASQHAVSQHIVQIAQQQSELPPTPQMTQVTNNQSFGNPARIEDSGPGNTEMEEAKGDHATQTSSQASRSRPARTSEIPSVISTWFAPSRSSQKFVSSSPPVADEIPSHISAPLSTNVDPSSSQPIIQAEPATSQEEARSEKGLDTLDSQIPSTFSLSQTQKFLSKGLLTPLSYYTPLSNLATRLNVPASQSYNDPGIDLIAVVSKSTTIPQRAEKGPRDYYTTLSITDTSLWPRSARVQVFRPWKAALPKAEKGDALLLRSFEVFSAKGTTGFGLKSGEDAAWCVWRFDNENDELADGSGNPVWAHRGKEKAERGSSFKEEVRGPPVEVGEEEREHVNKLKHWWSDVEKERNGHGQVENGESLHIKAAQ